LAFSLLKNGPHVPGHNHYLFPAQEPNVTPNYPESSGPPWTYTFFNCWLRGKKPPHPVFP